jgi:hypothetical protein
MVRKHSAVIVLLAGFVLVGAAAVGADGAKLAFNWAFSSRAADGSAVPIDFSEHVKIKPGQLFKISVEPIQNAYVYLYLHDAAGELTLLFPAAFDSFDAPTYFQTSVVIPEGDNWFQLDGSKGTERFYLLASPQRLKNLESLTQRFRAVDGDPKSTTAAKGAARQAVVDEIARVRSQHSQVTIAAEKPVTVAGGTRGLGTTRGPTRIEATEFYTRTFRLDH